MRINGLKRMFGALAATLCGGALLASSCTSEELQAAVLAGVETATDQLAHSAQDDEISFLDWVNSELDD